MQYLTVFKYTLHSEGSQKSVDFYKKKTTPIKIQRGYLTHKIIIYGERPIRITQECLIKKILTKNPSKSGKSDTQRLISVAKVLNSICNI